jgi:hypothetical protein
MNDCFHYHNAGDSFSQSMGIFEQFGFSWGRTNWGYGCIGFAYSLLRKK